MIRPLSAVIALAAVLVSLLTGAAPAQALRFVGCSQAAGSLVVQRPVVARVPDLRPAGWSQPPVSVRMVPTRSETVATVRVSVDRAGRTCAEVVSTVGRVRVIKLRLVRKHRDLLVTSRHLALAKSRAYAVQRVRASVTVATGLGPVTASTVVRGFSALPIR